MTLAYLSFKDTGKSRDQKCITFYVIIFIDVQQIISCGVTPRQAQERGVKGAQHRRGGLH